MTQRTVRIASLATGVAVSMLGTPGLALAEEENKGALLLLPNIAEIVPATVAFIIIFVLMAKFAWPSVLKMMEDRENKIQGDLDAAEEAKQSAEAGVAEIEQRLAEAEREAERIVADARREAEEERSHILSKAQQDAMASMAKARDVVESERKKAMIEISGSVVDLSVEIASKIVGNDLTDDQHRALAERYLEEVGSTDGN